MKKWEVDYVTFQKLDLEDCTDFDVQNEEIISLLKPWTNKGWQPWAVKDQNDTIAVWIKRIKIEVSPYCEHL